MMQEAENNCLVPPEHLHTRSLYFRCINIKYYLSSFQYGPHSYSCYKADKVGPTTYSYSKADKVDATSYICTAKSYDGDDIKNNMATKKWKPKYIHYNRNY